MANLTNKRAIVNNNNPDDEFSTIDSNDVLKAYTDIEAINNEVKQFGFNAALTNLLIGEYGYFGGYLPNNTFVSDGSIIVAGVVDQFIWLDLDTVTIMTGPTLPGGSIFEMMIAPWDGMDWQPPIDIRPTAASGAGGGDGVVTGQTSFVLIGTGDNVETDFILPVDSAEEIIFVDWGLQVRGAQYIRTYNMSAQPIIRFYAPWTPALGQEVLASVSGPMPPTPTYPFRNWYEALVWRPF